MTTPTTPNNPTAAPAGEPKVRSSALLEALFGKYVDADTERREILQRLQDESGAYKDATRRTQEAWNNYDAEQKRQASNADIRRGGTKP